MKKILTNKWIVALAAIFAFASFVNATTANYHDTLTAPGMISKVYTTNVPSACSATADITVQGNCSGHIEVWNNYGTQIISLDSPFSGTSMSSGSGPAGTYYAEHWGLANSGNPIYLFMRTILSWS